jgi:hypothetical protein
MGRKARLKRERREKRKADLDEAWGYFTSRSFLKEVRRMVLDSGATPDSCIACTKVLCELGKDLGLEIGPMVVETSIYNPVFADYIEQHGLDPSAEDMMRLGSAGGRFVVLGSRLDREPEPNKWPGHLVAVMRAKGKPTTVIDLSIDQANRPKKDINIVDPQVFGVPSDFDGGTFVAIGFTDTKVGKICLVYRAVPDDKSYEDSPDWQRDYQARGHDKIEFEGLPEKTPV